ncbi:MAG TPA: SIMPL domain-containing protein [Gemmatimonadaceae bacterium]|nr:SIMPL domain-containing protein [Gemmatimonadaceae bacterium]
MPRPSITRLFGLLSVAVVAATPAPVFAQAAGPSPSRPEIVTSATGEAQLTPDRAAVYVGVQTRASTAALAARENAQKQTAIIDAIVALGISREQISTENYTVAPDTRYDQSTQRTTVTGYIVSNVVRVEVRRIEQVAPVLDTALGKGANQINSLDFFASNSDSARHEALAQAIAKARGDAEAMARAAGGSLGALVELSTSDVGPRPVSRITDYAMMAKAAPTPIEPGQQRLQVSVSARWLFVPR